MKVYKPISLPFLFAITVPENMTAKQQSAVGSNVGQLMSSEMIFHLPWPLCHHGRPAGQMASENSQADH